jgi:HEAT repeat protein
VPNRQITPLLLPLLSDSVVNIREAAATAIGFDGNTGAIEDLIVTLMDDDAQVRQAAHQSLDRIDPNWTGSDGARAARPRLESMASTCQDSDQERLQQLLESIPLRESYGDAISTPSADYGYQG